MPAVKERIGKLLKQEQSPLVYLEYTPKKKLKEYFKPKNLFAQFPKRTSNMRICMGYVSHPYENTYRITTCRHLISNKNGNIPSKTEILDGLEVFARYEGFNKKFHDMLFEDINIKIHEDPLADLLFIEITNPDNYNFLLLEQASHRCRRRYPGSQVYYFQHHKDEIYFRLFEGAISRDKIHITEISTDGYYLYQEDKPDVHHRTFNTIHTTKEVVIIGASGSPILSRRGEVIGMMCAHHQNIGRGIYLSIEKIERLYGEINSYH